MKRFRKGQSGFTLVEVAIVLVIVGLILFAVLKGQEMVKQGKIKKSAKQVEELQGAVFGYVDKYRGKFPGEDGGAQATSTGVLEDLAVSQLISYDATVGMKNAYGGAITATLAGGIVTVTSPQIPDYAARSIDLAFDDGDGTKGNIIISGAVTPYASTDQTEDTTERTLEIAIKK